MRNLINWAKRFYIFIFIAVIYIPMIIVIIISFCGQTDRGNINYGMDSFSMDNYPKLFANDTFLNALVGSLLLGLVTTPLVVVIATITCFGIWRTTKLQTQLVMTSSNFAIVSPDAITGISLLLLFTSVFLPMGVNLGFFTVVLAHISFCVPYAIIAIYPRITKLNVNTVLASYDLGAGKIRTFFKIVVPFLLPGIISGAIIAFAMSLDDYIITNLVNGSFQTIGVAIYSARKGIKAWIITFGAIIVIITIIIVGVKMLLLYFRENIERKNKILSKIAAK